MPRIKSSGRFDGIGGADTMEQTYVTLNNGCNIPQFGLGVYQIQGDADTEKACLAALGLGYRHIDTAHAYQNERLQLLIF